MLHNKYTLRPIGSFRGQKELQHCRNKSMGLENMKSKRLKNASNITTASLPKPFNSNETHSQIPVIEKAKVIPLYETTV